MKVVINTCFGGFSLSKDACDYLGIEKGECWDYYRADPKLVECVEVLGRLADGPFSQLAIIEIPDDVEWKIADYDGIEWVEELHRWWNESGEHFG